MHIGTVIVIIGVHDARDAASQPTKPVLAVRCRASETWSGSGELMNASQAETAVRSALDQGRAWIMPALLGVG
jgi:hypothetical protein